MARPLRPVVHVCRFCGSESASTDVRQGLFQQHRDTLGTTGAFWCTFDERVLCDNCRPAPTAGETDLRGGEPATNDLRVIVTHRRRPVQRALWLDEAGVSDLKSILLGRRDREYFNPAPVDAPDSQRTRWQAWWRDFRQEIEGTEPDLGEDLDVYPRCLDFGELGAEPVTRVLHLLNPTGRSAQFEFTSNITVFDPAGRTKPTGMPYGVLLTSALELARRGHKTFEVAAGARLAVDVLAQPWARTSDYRSFELWVTPEDAPNRYIGMIDMIHRP